MTREFFNRQFAALVTAYTIANKLPDESQDVYWEMLQDLPEDKFHAGVKHCLATCKYFPTIAELGEASLPTIIELSSYLVQTKNGLDRVPLKVSWKQQLERGSDRKTIGASRVPMLDGGSMIDERRTR